MNPTVEEIREIPEALPERRPEDPPAPCGTPAAPEPAAASEPAAVPAPDDVGASSAPAAGGASAEAESPAGTESPADAAEAPAAGQGSVPPPPAPAGGAAEAGPAPAGGEEPAAAEASVDRAALLAELARLRQELELRRQASARLEQDCGEFLRLYPEVPLSEVPEEIWDEARRGVPLAAAYARAERRRTRTEELARQANARNRTCSAGPAGQTAPSYFSPDEVRAMSAAEVRQNYRTILQSMRKWS